MTVDSQAAEAAPAPGLPPRDGDAPLHELDRDTLSVFLYLAFTDPELTDILRELRISLPGYRMETLGAAARADLVADELRARPQSRAQVIKALATIYEFPALDGVSLPATVAEEVALLAVEEDATIRMLWRVLADPSPEVRATAKKPLTALANAYYGPADKNADPNALPVATKRQAPGGPAGDAQLRKEAQKAKQEAEHFKKKNEELKAQLKTLRGELADLQRAASANRKVAERLTAKVEKQAATPAKKTKVAEVRAELEQTLKHADGLDRRVSALEEREEQYEEENEKLRDELEAARRELAQRANASTSASAEENPVEAAGELPSTWMLPTFTREFYDSLDGWEPRIQRTAFKQAMLLSENHRHPSLRAIPLEGIPGYFRVRIATDVRLIYRRREGDNGVEVLSLIDREDLDRYVRQAKTRD